MTCGKCANWRLTGPLAAQGFGTCKARPEHLRAAITTPAASTCRIGKWTPIKEVIL